MSNHPVITMHATAEGWCMHRLLRAICLLLVRGCRLTAVAIDGPAPPVAPWGTSSLSVWKQLDEWRLAAPTSSWCCCDRN
ncbi:hypothetical protein C8Q78DRAFT_1028948 [Trametes maxima]|nr:hypothetical protein C8Q78DRAFT_1028948 [Trametes maxima]